MKVKLTEICTPKQWKTIPTNALLEDGYPVYGANGIIGYYDEYNHEEPVIAITCRGATCGTINLTVPKAYITGNAMCLDNVCADVLPDYLYYCLLHYNFNNIISGSAQPQITRQGLAKVEIELHPIIEQGKIINSLRKSKAIINARQSQLQKLDDLVKARFVEMFGDLKTNPKGWPILSFPEFAEIDGNMTTDYERYADYPHIGIDSIEKGTGKLSGYRTVREDGVISGKYIFTPKHIIYSKIRPNLNKVALPDFYGLCSADAYPVLPNYKNCNRIFLATAMRSEYFLEYILQFSSRTNLPKVNRKEIAGFRMPLPPLSLQEQFATFVEQVDKSKAVEGLYSSLCL
jgi:type I restriction enzyme S subunit